FKSKYKPKAIKGNAVLIMQGTGKIQSHYVGTFTIQRCLRGEQFTQIKIQKDTKKEEEFNYVGKKIIGKSNF
ncbi:hypothetical protein, partial [Latilactobacillus graminis]|uniref:hypothetical protein n=1 Tax=Latilactobacillus graminis TaxID=60519 RepID=UPI000B28CCDC